MRRESRSFFVQEEIGGQRAIVYASRKTVRHFHDRGMLKMMADVKAGAVPDGRKGTTRRERRQRQRAR